MTQENNSIFQNTTDTVVWIAVRNIIFFVGGSWFFEIYLDYKLPREENLLLFFVAIPIIWATLLQLWTAYSYHDVRGGWINAVNHVSGMLIVLSSVFIISVVLNTVSDILDWTGAVMFHIMGWTVLLGMGVYELVDAAPHDPKHVVDSPDESDEAK